MFVGQAPVVELEFSADAGHVAAGQPVKIDVFVGVIFDHEKSDAADSNEKHGREKELARLSDLLFLHFGEDFEKGQEPPEGDEKESRIDKKEMAIFIVSASIEQNRSQRWEEEPG